jgi:hypothetical protein
MRKKLRRNSGLKISPKKENEISMFGNTIQNCEIGMSPEISSIRKNLKKRNDKDYDSDSDN